MSKITIERAVLEQALEWVEAQPEPRMLGAAKIITSLREALTQQSSRHVKESLSTVLEQPQPVQQPVLKVYKGEICYKSEADDQSYGMWCPVTYNYPHGLPDDTNLYTSPQAQMPMPDIFWNSDDADEPHDSIGCFLNEQICQHDLEVGAVFTIWRAKKFPSMTIRVTAIDEEECEAEYEVIEQAHGITKGTT